MAAISFPTAELLAELKSSAQLEESLDLYAQILVSHPDHAQVAQWCRKYLASETGPRELLMHGNLRRAVYYVVFNQRLLVDSPVETYWDAVATYASANESVVFEYLASAPRSIPLKMSRLLLYKAEFGDQRLKGDDFERAIIVLFSARNIADEVINTAWTQKLKVIKTPEAKAMAECAEYFESGGPVHTLCTLLPQYSASRLFGLLKITGLPVDQLTERIFEDADYVDNTISNSAKAANTKNTKSKKYIKLDEKEKDARDEALRLHNQKNFAYKYVSLEDEDPDPEEGPVEPELSEADKKLIAQEEILWDYWQNHKEVFDRSSRKSELRKALSNKLKWTNEQIEGWGRIIGTKGREKDIQLEGVNEVESYAPATKSAAPPKSTAGQKPSSASKPDKHPSASKPDKNHADSKPKNHAESKPKNHADSKPKSNQGPPRRDNASSASSASKEKKPISRNRPKNSGKKNHSRKDE